MMSTKTESSARPPEMRRPIWVLIAIGQRRFGVPVQCVQEVVDDALVTPVLAPDPHLLGFSGWRGEIIPVLDLAGMMEIAPAEGIGRLLVVKVAGRIGALRVCDVRGIAEVDPTETEPLPLACRPAERRLVDAVWTGAGGGSLVGLLDIDRLVWGTHCSAPPAPGDDLVRSQEAN